MKILSEHRLGQTWENAQADKLSLRKISNFCRRFLAESWIFELFLFEFLVAFDLFAENMFRFQSVCLKITLGIRKTYEIMVKIGAFVRKFSKTQNLACGRIFTFLMSALKIKTKRMEMGQEKKLPWSHVNVRTFKEERSHMYTFYL